MNRFVHQECFKELIMKQLMSTDVDTDVYG